MTASVRTAAETTTLPVVDGRGMRDVLARNARDLTSRVVEHDRDGTFVSQEFELLRATGYLAAPVPLELGGGGASLADVVAAQRELGALNASAALATAMHLHAVLTAAWRWRRGETVVEGMLKRVAGGAVVASTGGGDFVSSTATARPHEDGGYVITGRKHFVSGAPAADLFSTWARVDGTDELIGFGVPAGADGVHIDEVWDAVGMRGTGSHDLVLTDARVPAAAVNGHRRIGEPDPLLVGIAAHAFPVVMAVYLGVAEGARDEVVEHLRRRGHDIARRRLIGAVDDDLLVGGLTLDGLVAGLAPLDDPSPDVLVRVMLAKRAIAERAQAAVERCMEIESGGGFMRGSSIGRAWRDVRGAGLHPLGAEQVLMMAGAAALGSEITTLPPQLA